MFGFLDGVLEGSHHHRPSLTGFAMVTRAENNWRHLVSYSNTSQTGFESNMVHSSFVTGLGRERITLEGPLRYVYTNTIGIQNYAKNPELDLSVCLQGPSG